MPEPVCTVEMIPDVVAATFENEKSALSRPARLTPREREILTILARGLYYREIGELLGISQATVRAHLHSAYKKLQVKSRARAVIKMNEIQSRPASEAVLA